MDALDPLAERILTTFLRLIRERGIEATTTRVLAEQAGIHETTIFRRFSDKAALIRATYRLFAATESIQHYPLHIDTSSIEHTREGVLACVRFLATHMRQAPQLLQLGASALWRYPQLQEEFAATPKAALALLEAALTQAGPRLRSDVDQAASAFALLGLIYLAVTLDSRQWVTLSEARWERLLSANVALLFPEQDQGTLQEDT